MQRRKIIYHVSLPWHELAQVRVVEFHPVLTVSIFLTPLLCVAAFTAVVLYPLPWQLEQAIFLLLCFEWCPDDGGIAWQLPHDAVGVGDGLQLRLKNCISSSWVEIQSTGLPDPEWKGVGVEVKFSSRSDAWYCEKRYIQVINNTIHLPGIELSTNLLEVWWHKKTPDLDPKWTILDSNSGALF